MESLDTITHDTELNELVKIYAEKKNISELAAYMALKKKWIPRSQVYDLVNQNQNAGETAPPSMTSDLLLEKTRGVIEKARLEAEHKRLELLDKSEIREQRRLDLQEAKIASDEKRQQDKIESDEKIARERLQYERDVENRRQNAKEDFDHQLLLIQEKKTGSGDLLAQIDQVNKLEQTFADRMIARAEAYGIDVTSMKKAIGNSKSTEGESGIGKLYDVGKLLWKNYVEPAADKAQKELSDPPPPTELSPDVKLRIQEETRLKVDQMEKENRILQQQFETETQAWKKQREGLEFKTSELGIEYNKTQSNDEIFSAIERQEISKQLVAETEEFETQRHTLISRALDLGIPFDITITTNDELATMIDRHQAVLDELQGPEPKEQVDVDTHTLAAEQEVPAAEQEVNPKETVARSCAQVLRTIPRLQQKATKELKKFNQEKVQEIPAAAKVKKPRKAATAKVPQDLKNFTILMDDPEKTFIKELEAKSHRSAALLIAKQLKGTPEAPVRIRIKLSGEELEKVFDTWIAEKVGKKGTVFLPRAKEIKEILEEPPEIQPEP